MNTKTPTKIKKRLLGHIETRNGVDVFVLDNLPPKPDLEILWVPYKED